MKKNPPIWIALLLLFVFHLINNLAVILRDTTPFIADASDYYKTSFYYWKATLSFIKFGDFYSLGTFCFPGLGGQLPALIAIPFYFGLGVSHDVAIIANQSFFLILILSIFGIGKTLFNRNTGMLAAFIISFYPAVFGFSRVYMLEFPILAIAALCVYLLIKSDGFKNLKYSIYFGLAFGLGSLLRPRFSIYIIFAVFFYLIKNIINLCNGQAVTSVKLLVKKIIINIIFSAGFCYILLFPWYSLSNISEYFDYQKTWSSWPHFSKIHFTLPDYLLRLWDAQLGWFFVSLFLIGLSISFFDKNKRPKVYFLLLWFILTLIFVASFGLSDYPRLVVPLSIPIALLSAVGLERLEKRKNARYLLFILLSFSIIQYLFVSYINLYISKQNKYRHFFSIALTTGLLHANSYDWKIDEIISTFTTLRNFDTEFSWRSINRNFDYLKAENCRQGEGNFIKVLQIEFRGSPIGNEIEEKIVINDFPISIVGLYPEQFDFKKLFSDKELQSMVLGADYIVKFELTPSRGKFFDNILNIFEENISKFEKLKTLQTPWGECLIYGRKIEKF